MKYQINAKGAIYYVTIAAVIFSRVKIVLYSQRSLSHAMLRLGTDSLYVTECPKVPNHWTIRKSRSQNPKLKVPHPKNS